MIFLANPDPALLIPKEQWPRLYTIEAHEPPGVTRSLWFTHRRQWSLLLGRASRSGLPIMEVASLLCRWPSGSMMTGLNLATTKALFGAPTSANGSRFAFRREGGSALAVAVAMLGICDGVRQAHSAELAWLERVWARRRGAIAAFTPETLLARYLVAHTE